MCELLSPAGSFEKLKSAVRFGADAVYFAGKAFGMRSGADNFTVDEIYEAVKYCHERGVKAYLTLNTMAHEDEYDDLSIFLHEIRDAKIDAFIVSDLGVMSLLREVIPTACIHISTQASVVSSKTAIQYMKLGAERIVLARELTLEEIKKIRANVPPELELEVFVHGSMCVSYSGRCLLSNHFTGRDANRGACAQPCRWNYNLYNIKEEKRPDDALGIEEYDNGTFILASRDLCMIEHIPELLSVGVDCLKIEGRMKSAYYTAVVTNAYKSAITAYKSSPETYTFDPLWLNELEAVSHREYDTGFFFDKPNEDSKTVSNNGYIREKAYLATALDFDRSTQIATFMQKNKLTCGEEVELLSPGKHFKGFYVDEIYDEEGNVIPSAPHPSMIFKLKVPFEVKIGDILLAK